MAEDLGGDVFDSLSDAIRPSSDGYAITGFTFSGARAKKIFSCSKLTILETFWVELHPRQRKL